MAKPAEIRQDKDRHKILIEEMANLFQPVFDLSSDAMYVYLDDVHKLCNSNLAELWGYSQEEWNNTSPFLDNLIAEGSRFTLMKSYEQLRISYIPAKIKFTGVRKDGSKFDAEIAVIPMGQFDQFFTFNLVKPL